MSDVHRPSALMSTMSHTRTTHAAEGSAMSANEPPTHAAYTTETLL